MQGDEGVWKPKQGEKHEGGNLLKSKRPFSPLSASSWRLFLLLKDVNQADDCDLAGLVELLESVSAASN